MNEPSDLRDLLHRLSALNNGTECFLCAKQAPNVRLTDEHVIPKWAQRRYNLWDQTLGLLNGTRIPYRQLTVPCCADCNKYRLKPIEDSIAATVESGRSAVAALGHKTLLLWLGKLFYGLLYKELSLLSDRSNPGIGPIVRPEILQIHQTVRLFLQQAAGTIDLVDFVPGSVFVFTMQRLPEDRMCWDFLDGIEAQFVGCHVGRTAIISILGDGGAQQLYEDEYKDLEQIELHPYQFRELCARIAYRATLATRVPKYFTFEGTPHQTYQMPLGGLSSRPLFEGGDPADYAKVLAQFTGEPLEAIYTPPAGVITWLRNEQGKPVKLPFKQFPVSFAQ